MDKVAVVAGLYLGRAFLVFFDLGSRAQCKDDSPLAPAKKRHGDQIHPSKSGKQEEAHLS